MVGGVLMKILIVEDEVNAREGLGNLLVKLSDNYVVCGKASDGEQGLMLAKVHKPDLIFTDIEMPKLNGLDMLQKIKEDGQDPYVMILSGYSDFKYAQKGIRLGVEEYLLKPITYSNLKSSMEQIERKFGLKKEKAALLEDGISKEEILGRMLLNKGKNLENLYNRSTSYLSVAKRTKSFNEKLNHCIQLMEIIKQHLTDAKHTRLEWIIIYLIAIEVAVAFGILDLIKNIVMSLFK